MSVWQWLDAALLLAAAGCNICAGWILLKAKRRQRETDAAIRELRDVEDRW